MSCCNNPPNRPPPELIDRLIDQVAWAKTCLLITADTPPKSPERDTELAKLRAAVVDPRQLVDEILAKVLAVPRDLLVELRVCELAIPKLEAGAVLRTPSTPRGTP